MTEQRRILNSFEWILLVAVALLLLYILNPDKRFRLLERSEKVEILDKPSNSGQLPKARKNVVSSEDKQRERVNETLESLAHTFANGQSNRTQAAAHLSTGEQAYLERVRAEHQWSDKLRDAKDWYRLLTASHKTYSTLRRIISEASGEAGVEVEQKSLDELFNDHHTADDIYIQLERLYAISRQKASDFAQGGRKSLADWADFIENNRKDQLVGQDFPEFLTLFS